MEQIISILQNIVSFVVVLGIVVFIHELGHLLAAKAFGVYCYEFAIGFGPRIFKYKGKETTYSLRLLPLGGFVSMAGDDEVKDGPEVPIERQLPSINRFKRIVVMLAGIIFNILLAWTLFTAIFTINGINDLPLMEIASVVEGSPAEKGGLMAGDTITHLEMSDGSIVTIESINDFSVAIQLNHEEAVYTVIRDGQTINLKITPELNDQKVYTIGVYNIASTHRNLNFFEAMGESVKYLADMAAQMGMILSKVIRGQGLNALSGPIGIFTETGKAAQAGIMTLIAFTGVISFNVGLFNLLPLPIFDGGRVLITCIEMIIRRPLGKRFENALMMASFFLIILLFIFVAYNDILRQI